MTSSRETMDPKRGVRRARVRSARTGRARGRAPGTRDLATAQHEAAHVVVGAALGLKLRKATLGRRREGALLVDGLTEFDGRFGSFESWLVMLAAGVAWERAMRRTWAASGDRSALRRMGCTTARSIEALALVAGAMLRDRSAAHARVTRALFERDLTGSDVAALARGERLQSE